MGEGKRQLPATIRIDRGTPDYPATLVSRLGDGAPKSLVVLGDPLLLGPRRTALFCSARTPGEAILRAHDAAQRMRDEGTTVISGFHAPIEVECLHILLRGKQPIIICPARAIEGMRILPECRTAFDNGRVLFLSPFVKAPVRITKQSAARRNDIVAALADTAYVAHITPGGQTEKTVEQLRKWGVSIVN